MKPTKCILYPQGLLNSLGVKTVKCEDGEVPVCTAICYIAIQCTEGPGTFLLRSEDGEVPYYVAITYITIPPKSIFGLNVYGFRASGYSSA